MSIFDFFKKKKADMESESYSHYPANYYLNNAMSYLLDMKVKSKSKDGAISEIYYAVMRCNGQFSPRVACELRARGFNVPRSNILA